MNTKYNTSTKRESKMDRTILLYRLEHFIQDKFVNLEEYQDKFYLKKMIQEILQWKSDDVIYQAIEQTNASLLPPRRKVDFINTLLEKLQV